MILMYLTYWDAGSRHLDFTSKLNYDPPLLLKNLIQIQFSRGFQFTKDLNKFSSKRETAFLQNCFFLPNLLPLAWKFLNPWNTHWKKGPTHALVRQELIFYLGYLYWTVRQLLSCRIQIIIPFSTVTVRYCNFCALAAFMAFFALFQRPLTFLSDNYQSSGSCIPRLF